MVQKGKFSAAADCFVSTLKKVDLLHDGEYYYCSLNMTTPYPTLGSPTIPHLREVPNLPSRGPGPSDSDVVLFLGGILLLYLASISKLCLASWLDLCPVNSARNVGQLRIQLAQNAMLIFSAA